MAVKTFRGEGHLLNKDEKYPASFDLTVSKTDESLEVNGRLTLSFEHVIEVHALQNPVQLEIAPGRILKLDLGSSRGNVIEVAGLRTMPD